MNNVELDPKVEQFKTFVQDKPEIVKVVRSGKKSWQELFEDWLILGEDHEDWKTTEPEVTQEIIAEKNQDSQVKSDGFAGDLWPQILSYIKRLDINQIQDQLTNLGTTLTAVQEVVSQFQPSKQATTRRRERPKSFGFRKD